MNRLIILIIFTLIIFSGCKPWDDSYNCGDPVDPSLALKIIIKSNNKVACQFYDSIELKSTIWFRGYKQKIKARSWSDSTILISYASFDTILFRFDSTQNFDTLIPFTTFFPSDRKPCSNDYLRLDSIYHNQNKVNSNIIYF